MEAAFPFHLLHAEMVEHAEQRAKERQELRQQMKEEQNVDEKLMLRAFAHHTAATCLESLGWRVGYVLAEKLSKDSAKMNTELDVMKFICKEFWTSFYGKQVDNLRTNHQGVYVVQDNHFSTLAPLSPSVDLLAHTANFLAFPCGVIRGALSALAVTAQVTSSVDSIPAVKFHIQIQQKATK